MKRGERTSHWANLLAYAGYAILSVDRESNSTYDTHWSLSKR
jgi:hypothetical protein